MPTSGPGGLIRSLINQLLLDQDFPLDFVDNRQYRDDIRDCYIPALCDTFKSLIRRWPSPKEIVCLIDNIALFEQPEWQEELDFVVSSLCELAGHPDLQGIFKVLLTSSSRSRSVRWQVEQEPCGAVYEVIPERWTARGGLTERNRTMLTARSMQRHVSHEDFTSVESDDGYGSDTDSD